MLESATIRDDRRSVDLFSDRDVLTAALDTDTVADRIEALARTEAKNRAQDLYRAADHMNDRARWGLGTVLDILAAGRAHVLAAHLASPDRLADYVIAAISTKLVEDVGARWVHVWGEPLTLRSADDEVIELRTLVTAGCADPARVAALRARLGDLGLADGTIAASSVRGVTGFDPGLLLHTLPGTTPSEPLTLLLPDRLYLLTRGDDGRWRVPSGGVEVATAAAALAELRRRDAIELADGDVGTVRVVDIVPTGDRFLDSVLARLIRGGSQPAYQWLSTIGPDVAATVRHRLGMADYIANDGALTATGDTTVAGIRADVVAALRASDADGGDPLAMLLWAAGLDEVGTGVDGPRAAVLRRSPRRPGSADDGRTHRDRPDRRAAERPDRGSGGR